MPLSEEGTMHKFVLIGKDPSPVEITQGYLSVLDECATTHEEADVVIVQQMVHIAVAKQGQCVIKIIVMTQMCSCSYCLTTITPVLIAQF